MTTLHDDERQHFDTLFDQVLDAMPQAILHWIEQVPLIVEDHPADDILEEFGCQYTDELCGLHDGIPLTDQSVEHSGEGPPDHIMIYREGIIAAAADPQGNVPDTELRRQIHITVLHELGHHFGLDEQQLENLGYG